MVELATRLFPMRNPDVVTVTSTNELDFDAFEDEATALFIHIPAADSHRLKWLSACLILQAMRYLHQRADAEGGRLPRGVAFYLDEFGNQHIPKMEQYISIVRSAGIAFLMAVQGLGQIEQAYDEQALQTILANASTHVIFGGMGHTDCVYYSDRMGDTTTTVQTHSSTYGGSGGGANSYSTGYAPRRFYTPDELRRLDPDKVLVIHEHTAPFLVRRVPYYEDMRLQAWRQLSIVFSERDTIDSVPPAALPAALVDVEDDQQAPLTGQDDQHPQPPQGAGAANPQPAPQATGDDFLP